LSAERVLAKVPLEQRNAPDTVRFSANVPVLLPVKVPPAVVHAPAVSVAAVAWVSVPARQLMVPLASSGSLIVQPPAPVPCRLAKVRSPAAAGVSIVVGTM
jgi:hypothetical protein